MRATLLTISCSLAISAVVGCSSGVPCKIGPGVRQSVLPDITPAPVEPWPATPPAAGDEPHRSSNGYDQERRDQEGARPETTHNEASGPGNSSFRIPSELPGADAPPLRLPPLDQTQTEHERRSLLEGLFPDLPPLTDPLPATPRSTVDLSELQQLAVQRSPALRQAVAEVRKAHGNAVQVGLYPNPMVGYQGDTIGTGRTAGYNGMFASQEVVTAGKRTLAQQAAWMEVCAAQLAVRKARVELATAVRRAYFRVLIAQEKLQFQRAMAQLTNAAYQAQIDLVAGGEAAAYEPLQLRVLALQSRNNIVEAQNAVLAAWRQLAAHMGVPELEYIPVKGSPEAVLPTVGFIASRSWMLESHTDLAIARAMIDKANYDLRLQQVTPIPNVHLYSALQKDDTTPLNDVTFNVQVGVPVPVFDRNQGNITRAMGELNRAKASWEHQRNDLIARLSEAHGRLSTYSEIVDTYRSDIVPDQVRVYRGVYERFRGAGDTLDFTQVVVAQQTLAQVVTSYLQALTDQWTALVDVAELLQAEDLYAIPAQFPTDPARPPGSAELLPPPDPS